MSRGLVFELVGVAGISIGALAYMRPENLTRTVEAPDRDIVAVTRP